MKAKASASNVKKNTSFSRKTIEQTTKSIVPVARPSLGKDASAKGKSAMGLTREQKRDLEKRLYGLKDELRMSIDEKANLVVNTAQLSESLIKGDDAEVAEKQRVSNAALQELDILKNRLTLVERAIAKMNAGFYGICEETEEPIGYERLMVVPWARYSVHVQEIRERKLREFRVSKLRAEA